MTKTQSTAAQAAAAIRKELKAAFPGVTFRVTCKNYSGGNSVRASWTDGPTTNDVRAITGKYQYGHFDGMTDCYDYSNSRDDIPQARFVFADREISAERMAAVRDELSQKFGIDFGDQQAVWAAFNAWPDAVIYRHIAEMSY